jgi:putative sugar O-methyltransferase
MGPVHSQEVLRTMFNDMHAADKVYLPSPFWEALNEVQIKQLEGHGLEHFKRTVNMRYFNWDLKGIVAHQLWPVLKHWANHPDFSVFSHGIAGNWSIPGERETLISSLSQPLVNRTYATYLMLLKQYVAANDPRGLLERIGEPLVGNPLVVKDGEKTISQDLCNSVHEFYSSTRGVDVDKKGLSVFELGAGYGRVGFVFLKALESSTYTIVDIPPALFVAQSYLSTVFPDTKVFAFRPFRSYAEIKDEFESARIRFIGAHQIKLLPDKSADLFINISSLHEMTMEQIDFYLKQIDRLTRGSFYLKQWRRSRSVANGFRIRENDYPIPSRWSAVYRERHPLQRMFFHALYSVPA